MRKKLFFSDECAVYAASKDKNVVMQSNESPHFGNMRINIPSVMVWAAMSQEYLIDPYFIEGSMNSNQYLQILEGESMLDLAKRGIREISHFQQDVAPSHTSRTTREFLNTNFDERWVGKFGPFPWPAIIPDLTSCDSARKEKFTMRGRKQEMTSKDCQTSFRRN